MANNIKISTNKHAPQAMCIIHKRCFDRFWNESYFRSLLHNNNYKIFTASDKNLVGFLVILAVKDFAEIITLAINPEKRRSGIASKLLKEAIKWLSHNQFSQLTLEVSDENFPAQELYKSLGFTEAGRRKNYYNLNGKIIDGLVYFRKI